MIQLTSNDHEKFKGSFTAFFQDLISLDKRPVNDLGCWRCKNGTFLCDGTRTDIRNIVASIPMLFAVEIFNECLTEQDSDMPLLIWDFPAQLFPGTKKSGKESGLVYNLMGYGLTNLRGDHFTARFASEDRKIIWTYDGMKHKGCSVQEQNAKFKTHMTGSKIRIPEGTVIYEAFYVLEGGPRAQELFYLQRGSALLHKFKLSLSPGLSKVPVVRYKLPGLTIMAPENRFWLLNPHRIKYSEYISTTAPKQIRQKDPQDIESEDEPVDTEQGVPLELSPKPYVYADDTEKISTEELAPQISCQPIIPAENTHKRATEEGVPPHVSLEPDLPTENTENISPPVVGTGTRESPVVSLPDSQFNLDCRCGINGDGNRFYDPHIYGTAIQCNQCKDWSHVACQRDGRASNLTSKDKFWCDNCDLRHLIQRHQPMRSSKKPRSVTNMRLLFYFDKLIFFYSQTDLSSRLVKPLRERLRSVIILFYSFSPLI